MGRRSRKVSSDTLDKLKKEKSTRLITKTKGATVPEPAKPQRVDIAKLITALANSNKQIVEAVNNIKLDPPPEVPQQKITVIRIQNIEHGEDDRISGAEFVVTYEGE